MYPEVVLHGTYNFGHTYLIEYDEHLAVAGLSPYYVHRARYKGDKIKNQRTVSELPIPEPNVLLGGERRTDNAGEYFADVVIVKTFEEALAYLPNIRSAMTFEGSVHGDLGKYVAERERIERDAQIAHEDEMAEVLNEESGQLKLLF